MPIGILFWLGLSRRRVDLGGGRSIRPRRLDGLGTEGILARTSRRFLPVDVYLA